jgi:hypothetical protein
MHRGRWAFAAALAALAAAVVSAGCGGGSALALDPVAAAATKTQQAGAAHIRLTLAFSGPRRHVTVTGHGSIDGTSSELSLGSGSVREISLEQQGDYLLYLRAPFFEARLPGGKQWIELNLSKLGQEAGLGLADLMSGSQVSPGDLLSMLKAEGTKVQKLGAATIDGAATTHYRLTVDLAKAMEAKGLTSSSPLLAGLAARLSTVPVDVWIGNDGLLRRIQVALGSSHSRRHLGLRMDLYDYGADIAIAAPPSTDVFDVTRFAQQRLGAMFH